MKNIFQPGDPVVVRPGVYDDYYECRRGVVTGRDDWAYVPVKVMLDGETTTTWFKDAYLEKANA